jgi:NitT/TauT family transport system substrate-binding protein
MSAGNLTNLPVAIASVNLEGSAIVVNPLVIQSIADLSGKKVGTPGTGTIQETLLAMFAQEQNITIVKFPSSNANLPLDFSKGEAGGGVDALIAWEPTPSRVALQQNGSVLATSEDIFEDHQCCILIVTQKFMTEHPDIVTKMANIHRIATDYINSNPVEVKQIAANFTGQTIPVIEMAFNDVMYSTTLNTNSIRVFLLDLINQKIITTINASQVDTFLQDFIKPQ